MSRPDASDLANRLGQQAEAVCRHYLSSGRRAGKYWIGGDVRNAPGRSMFVRLMPSPKGPAGKWTDAATGEHGDLLDVIRESLGLADFQEVAQEARSFLALPETERRPTSPAQSKPAPTGSPAASRRLFGMSQPIHHTLVETYLRSRSITALHGTGALRFHPRCYYLPEDGGPTETWPAMIASVTDLSRHQTGAHRTWLRPDGTGKAPIDTPRRAMGDLLGHAVRFGTAQTVMAAGEGIETTLSLRCVLPEMPMAAALSSGHLGALLFPPTLRRLYIVRDNDASGALAESVLTERSREAGIETIVLTPRMEDFNEDLHARGLPSLRNWIAGQLLRRDRLHYLAPAD